MGRERRQWDRPAHSCRAVGNSESRRELNSQGEALFRTAALDQFSNTIEYALNLTYKVWDQAGALKWDYSGRQANFRTIDLGSCAYSS